MEYDYSGKVVAITGGSQGIGKAMAQAFASNGASVVIFARSAEEVQKAASGISAGGLDCEGRQLDVGDPAAVQKAFVRLVSERKRLDVLVNCAGIYGPIGPLEENDLGSWHQAVSINLCGTAFCTSAVLPQMKKQGSGTIIAMAGGGVGGPNLKPSFSSYISSKYGVCGFVEALSKELEGTGITINAISPGAINTRMLDQVLAAGSRAGQSFLDASKKQKASGGVSPQLACGLALFLSSAEARHVSGKILSAVWDRKETLLKKKIEGQMYTLKRIDGELYTEKKK